MKDGFISNRDKHSEISVAFDIPGQVSQPYLDVMASFKALEFKGDSLYE